MNLTIILIAVGLAMDAFAVSLCKGLSMKKFNPFHGFVIAMSFGLFQGIMPFIGGMVAKGFINYISSVDHWIAFVLLAFIGIKMLTDAFKDENECCCGDKMFVLDVKELLVLSVATSIDALVAGIAIAVENNNVVYLALSCSIVAGITFALSFFGVVIGNKFGSKYEKKATILGGVVLVGMGMKILVEHML